MWYRLLRDQDVEEGPAEQKWTYIPTLFTQNPYYTFIEDYNDEMPWIWEDRVKTIHQQGLHAKVKWTPVDNSLGYSGIYATGSDYIIMRLSEMMLLHEDSSGLRPAVAFKFLRDGTESDNIVTLPSRSGRSTFRDAESDNIDTLTSLKRSGGSWNFLEPSLKTRVTNENYGRNSCEDRTVKVKLLEGSQWAFSCGVGNIALHHVDGSTVDARSVGLPYELQFETN